MTPDLNQEDINIKQTNGSTASNFHIGADSNSHTSNSNSSFHIGSEPTLAEALQEIKDPTEILINLKTGSGEIDITVLFDYVREHGGSDLHLCVGLPPKIRLLGDIYDMPGWTPLTKENVIKLIRETMPSQIQNEFNQKKDIDFSFIDKKGRRYRCNAMQTLRGPVGVYRMISDKILSFEDLKLPESIRKIATYKKGLVLVTGPAGCGKSTTMATLVDLINQSRDDHILTIEDPVEILHHSIKSLVNHREVKTHTKSFPRALKSALREDPDCIIIGEMRDLETISLALTAAETGHLVFGTLHTSDAAQTITRIIDVFPSGKQEQIRTMLAESIQCVISQVLCKRKGWQNNVDSNNSNHRIAVFEIMFGTDAIRNLIRTNKIHQIPSSIETGMKQGMQSLDQALSKYVQKGIIELHEAKIHAKHPEEIK